MNIWLVTIGEPVPVNEGEHDRPYRTGQLARYLTARSHDVTWWTSTFDHFRKKHLFDRDTVVDWSPRLRIQLLHGRGYSRNLSVSRFIDHAQIAWRFSRLAPAAPAPDIVVAALPPVELARACVDYGAYRSIPVILDLRDMWPDIFLAHAPQAAAPILKWLLQPLFAQARQACAGAAALTGITEGFVDWGLRRAGRLRSDCDRAIPLSYSAEPLPPERIAQAARFWDNQGVRADSPEFTVCFFGALGAQFDFRHVIDAARLLNKRGAHARFVVCGSGERLESLRALASSVPNVLFPGWVDAAKIQELMQRSGAGLDPLPQRFDFLASVNNKAIEYLSAALPVIASPRAGALFEMLRDEGCGISYDSGDASALADATEALASNSTMRRHMAEASARVFRERFTADMVHENALRLILALTRPGTTSSGASAPDQETEQYPSVR